MNTGTVSDWTPERTERLVSLWADGHSASQCAIELGTTRNAIIGKVHRLKLPRRRPTVTTRRSVWRDALPRRYSEPKPKAPRKPKAARVPPRPKLVEPAIPAFELDPEFVIAMNAGQPLPGTTPITDILLLNDSVCRWPLGDPLLPGFAYCGCETATGSPYCPTHKVRATGQGTAFERAAEQKAERAVRMERMAFGGEREAA